MQSWNGEEHYNSNKWWFMHDSNLGVWGCNVASYISLSFWKIGEIFALVYSVPKLIAYPCCIIERERECTTFCMSKIVAIYIWCGRF